MVIVTGGGSGIELATAKAFGAEGAEVVVADTSIAAGQAVIEAITAAGGCARLLPVDISQPQVIE